MKKFIWRKKPDLLILVDYPGFNLRLAKVAKKAGIKVLYFISPKIWAWHQSRIETIKKYVDMMAVIFPFEVDLYKKWGVPVTFVGNPLLKLVPPKPSLLTMQKFFNLKPGGKTIALFPGSRISEIKRLLPVMLDAAQIIKSHYPNTQFLLSQASSITLDDLKTYLKQNPIEIQIITGQNYNIMAASDAIITASGTATLEIALVETPMVIIYRMSWLEAQIAKRLIKIPFVGLCNILLNKKITLELLQDDVTPEKIAAEIEKILIDDRYRQEMINNLKTIRTILDDGEKMDIGKLVVTMIG